MEQAWPIVNHIAVDLKTTPRVSLSEIWYNALQPRMSRGMPKLRESTAAGHLQKLPCGELGVFIWSI
jgi:hypothetical protein